MSDNGYPEEDKKKKKELIVGKVVDEIRKVIRGKIKEKVLIKRGDYREYKPLSTTNWDHPSKNKTSLGEGKLQQAQREWKNIQDYLNPKQKQFIKKHFNSMKSKFKHFTAQDYADYIEGELDVKVPPQEFNNKKAIEFGQLVLAYSGAIKEPRYYNEGIIKEGWKSIAKKKLKYTDKTGTYNWEITSGIDTDAHVGKNLEKGTVPKIILFYQHFGEKSDAHPKGYPSSGGQTLYLKHKNDTPYTPQEAKALVNKIANKKIGEFQRKSQFPSGTGQNIFYVDGKFIREAAKRDYKQEYKKFQSSTKSKKYRAELNKYNRKKGTYGNGDGKDASHKGGKIAGFEAESKNRGRAEKSRLKKEASSSTMKKIKDTLKYDHSQDLEDLLDKYKVDKKYHKVIAHYFDDIRDEEMGIKRSGYADASKKNLIKVLDKAIKESKLTEGMSSSQAKTLLQQLGGNKFKAMVGAKDFGIGSDGLHFKIGRNSKSISHIVIRLTSMDLYEMKFLRVRAGKITVVKKVNNVYNDMLGKIFTKYTGMHVRL